MKRIGDVWVEKMRYDSAPEGEDTMKTKTIHATEDTLTVDLISLSKRINRHRLDLRMTWPNYAKHMELPQSTIYKIAQGSTARPHALTVDQILQKLAAHQEQLAGK